MKVESQRGVVNMDGTMTNTNDDQLSELIATQYISHVLNYPKLIAWDRSIVISLTKCSWCERCIDVFRGGLVTCLNHLKHTKRVIIPHITADVLSKIAYYKLPLYSPIPRRASYGMCNNCNTYHGYKSLEHDDGSAILLCLLCALYAETVKWWKRLHIIECRLNADIVHHMQLMICGPLIEYGPPVYTL